MIAVKTEEQLEKMRAAGKIVGDTLRYIEPFVKPGISTLELNSMIEEYIRSFGAIPSFKNYNGFPAASCISVDDVVVHGIPSLRVLKEGEIVSIDVGALLDGYHGDAARTFPVGKISPEKPGFGTRIPPTRTTPTAQSPSGTRVTIFLWRTGRSLCAASGSGSAM